MLVKEKISHKGIVSAIGNNLVRVDLCVQSACASCHAKSVCGVDTATKTVEVRTDNRNYSVGETVNVLMQESLGIKALFLGYLIPFVVVVVCLFVMLELGYSELLSGLISISILLPYYLILYLFKNKIKREFNFEIEKV